MLHVYLASIDNVFIKTIVNQTHWYSELV